MRRYALRWAGSLLFLSVAGCGGNDGPAGPGGGAGMSARVDGQTWTASFAHGLRDQGGTVLGVAGQGGGMQINFAFADNGIGTYTIGADGNAFLTQGQDGWTAGGAGGSGAVTITTLTDTRIAGTFAFTAVAVTGGASGTREVTQGTFDVEFTDPIAAQ
jgi:hypothetical protein